MLEKDTLEYHIQILRQRIYHIQRRKYQTEEEKTHQIQKIRQDIIVLQDILNEARADFLKMTPEEILKEMGYRCST